MRIILFPVLLLFVLLLHSTSIAQGGYIRSCTTTNNRNYISTTRLCCYSHNSHIYQYNKHRTHVHKNAISTHGVDGRFKNEATISFPSSAQKRFPHQRHMTAMMTDPFQLLFADATTTATTSDIDDIGMLSKEATIIIFIIGIIPFIIATFEFWRRIAVGATFGTGSDSVVFPTTATTTTTIGEDNAPNSSRGKQILGTDSLITAYIIFATVAVVLGIVLYSVVTSPIPPSI